MSFARQFSICSNDDHHSDKPTTQEHALSSLQRPGMHGHGHIRKILRPGKYAFDPNASELWFPAHPEDPDVAEKRAASIRRPQMIRMEDVAWHQSQELSWTAQLSIESKMVSIPVDIADDAGLGYYNCRALGAGDVISLNNRSLVTNFCYHDDYFERYVLGVLGCWSIEQHEFAHVDTPLTDRSGYLVLGKVDPVDQALEMTAFIVESGLSVYIPAHTIHTNDYFLGTWETLLSSACEFPSAQLKQSRNEPLQFVYDQEDLPLSSRVHRRFKPAW